MITRFLKFMAPADDAAAVMEPPVKAEAEAPMTPVGDVYKEALEKAQAGEKEEPAARPDAKKTAPAKEPAAKEPAAKTEATEGKVETKPASALEAALGDTPITEKKEDATTEDPLKDFPEEAQEGQKRNWKGLRTVASTAIQQKAELQTKLEQATKDLEAAKSGPPETVKELESLKKTLDTYKDAIVAINLELDPEFRSKFVDGRAALVNKAASKLDAYGGKGEALKAALDMVEGRGRTQAIKEALGDLEDVERARVLQFVGEVEKLDDERADLQKDPQQAFEKFQRAQTEMRQKQEEQAEAYKKDVFEKVSKSLPAKLTLLKTVDPAIEGATEWNAGVEEIKAGAFKLLGNDATPEQLAEAALWATAGPKIQERWLADRAELTKARAALKEYEDSEPGFRGGKPPKKSEAEAKLEKSAGEIYKEVIAAHNNPEN